MISTKYFDKFISSQSVKDVIYRKSYVTQPKIEFLFLENKYSARPGKNPYSCESRVKRSKR